MSHETVHQQHLDLIIKECQNLQPDLTAIVLYGSFGREEGSWYQNAKGNWLPYNDYDLLIVSNKRIPTERLKNLEKMLAQEIGINWIDLDQFHLDEIKRLRPSILNYDFKNASKVIYGDSTVLDLIPEIDSTALPMKEAQILFFTRLYTLIGSLGEKGFDEELDGEASRFFRNQMAKAILAIVDVLLLAKGAYDASYCKRVERVAELYPEKEELLKLSKWALAEKLRPQSPIMHPKDILELYGLVHKHYFTEMYRGLSAHFGKIVNSPENIEFYMKWNPISLTKRLYRYFKFRSLRIERRLAVKLAQSYLASAWSQDGTSEKWLLRGIALLRSADAQVAQQITWDQARLEAVRLRMEV